MLPLIECMIAWIEGNVDKIKTQTLEKIPPETNAAILKALELTSISLYFKDKKLYASLSYGVLNWCEDQNSFFDDGTYLIATIKDNEIDTVEFST